MKKTTIILDLIIPDVDSSSGNADRGRSVEEIAYEVSVIETMISRMKYTEIPIEVLA